MTDDLATRLETTHEWTRAVGRAMLTGRGFRTQADSELDQDDAAVGGGLMTETAQLTLATALDHLRLATETLRPDRRGVPPMAVASLLRGALEGAAAASWILEPREREDRVVALMRLQLKDVEGSFAFSERRKTAEEQDRVAQIQRVAASVDPRKVSAVSSTEMVRALGDVTSATVLQWWRLMSGFAHARRWAIRVMAARNGLPTPRGTEVISVSGNRDVLTMVAVDAAHGLHSAIARWNELSGNADAGTSIERLHGRVLGY